jgi:hypothetical protein
LNEVEQIPHLHSVRWVLELSKEVVRSTIHKRHGNNLGLVLQAQFGSGRTGRPLKCNLQYTEARIRMLN